MQSGRDDAKLPKPTKNQRKYSQVLFFGCRRFFRSDLHTLTHYIRRERINYTTLLMQHIMYLKKNTNDAEETF